ncbi:MAG: anthranilate phosphoribosyltransferase [Pyrinomonadaceae bacterium]
MPKPEWLMDAPEASPGKKADTPLHKFLTRLMKGENLAFKEAQGFFAALSAFDANPAQISGCLVALASKGETYEELAGMAKVMREQASTVKTHHTGLIDITGTGSSPAKRFNISTATAFVVAGAGLAVAKHTSRGVTSKLGSAEALESLEVNVSGDPKLAQACLSGAGLAFLFAPSIHTSIRRIADVRRNLGIRTSLTLLGPLANPAHAQFQLLGVWHPALVEPMAQALALLGTKRAWVVHGTDGLDELTIAGKTIVAEVSGNKIRKFEISPEDFGLHASKIPDLKPKTPTESATIIRDVLESRRRDEARSLVVMNAAAALVIGGKSKNLLHAARMAEQSIDSGSARIKLDRLIQTTNK